MGTKKKATARTLRCNIHNATTPATEEPTTKMINVGPTLGSINVRKKVRGEPTQEIRKGVVAQ
jgi:hypothetical protein